MATIERQFQMNPFSNHLLVGFGGIYCKSPKEKIKVLASVPPHRLYLPVAY